jgi:hypothetical protein
VPRVPLIHGRRRGFHDSANLNLAKRRLCAALGISLGSSEHCCAISVARVRAALTASIPRSNRPLAQRTNFGAAKSCPLVIIFMIRQSGESNYAHRSRPYHGSRNSGDSERPTGMQSGGFETAGRWVGRQWAYVMKSLGQNRKSFGYGRPAKDEADLSSVRGAHAARQAIALARPQAARGSAVSVHRLRACRHG